MSKNEEVGFASTLRADLEVMVQGWFALAELDKHATTAGIPFVPFGGQLEPWCRECSRFAAALLRGSTPADALHLRCAQSQEWQRLVDAANAVATAAVGTASGGQPNASDLPEARDA